MYDAKEIRSDRALKIIGRETQVVQPCKVLTVITVSPRRLIRSDND